MPALLKDGPVMWCFSPAINPPAGSYAFSNGSTSGDVMAVLVRFVRLSGWKRIAVITTTDATGQLFDQGLQLAKAAPENKDIDFVAYEHMSLTDLSAAAQLARVKAANPQVLLAIATGGAFGTIMRNLNDAGMDLPVAGSNGSAISTQLEQYKSFLPARGVFFPGTLSLVPNSVGPGPIKDAQNVYFKAFREIGIAKPDLAAGATWDGAMLLVSAVRAIGTNATAEQVRDYILRQHSWTGINGVYDFSDGSQRGLSQRATVIDLWDPAKNEFRPASRPGGYLK
jgi:branched-chain amino acid transport system substrate-binding protein